MKKIIIPLFLMAAAPFVSHSQTANNSQPWKRTEPKMKEEGYWVIEGNVHSARNNTVYFYNSQNELVGRQEMSGKKLKANKSGTRRMLNAMLEKALENNAADQNASNPNSEKDTSAKG